MPILAIMTAGSVIAFAMLGDAGNSIGKVLPNSASNTHLNKVTNGQWHQWVAGDTSKVK